MGGVVADDIERAVGFRRDDLQRLARLQRPCEVAQLAVLAHGERGAREAGADRGGGIGARRAVGELELGSVRKGDVHAPIVTGTAADAADRRDSNPGFAMRRCGLTR